MTNFKFLQVPSSKLEDGADILEIWTGSYDLSHAERIASLTGPWEAQTIYSGNNYLTLRLTTDDSVLLPSSLVLTFTSGTVEGLVMVGRGLGDIWVYGSGCWKAQTAYSGKATSHCD